MNCEDTNKSDNLFNTKPISLLGPTATDIENAKSLENVLAQACHLQEHQNHRQEREKALQDIDEICQAWVKSSAEKQKYPSEFVSSCQIRLFTYGSFKLNVHSSTDDIDILCIGPKFVNRDLFFDELGNIFGTNPLITNLICIRNAYVPVISFKYNNSIDIDMVYAQLQSELVDAAWDIDDDSNLYGLDETSIFSIAGVRFAHKVLQLVPNKNVFRLSLRAVRYWAKQRAIYSNKIGYLGGVSYAILVAKVCQLYPNANVSQIIQKFFLFYHSWNFHSPFNAIALCDIICYDDMPDINVWHPDEQEMIYGAMYIITPIFPAMNSSHNVSLSTFQIIKKEIARGFHLLLTERSINENKWKELFTQHTFFMDYKQYIFIKGCSTQENIIKWSGLIESKIRSFVSALEFEHYTDINIQPYCKCIPFKVKQTDIDRHTHSDILEHQRLRKLHLSLRKDRPIEHQQQINDIYMENITDLKEPIILGSNLDELMAAMHENKALNPYCYVAPELQKKYAFNSYAYLVNKNEISCCELFNNKILKEKSEKYEHECRAFVIGINVMNTNDNYNCKFDFSQSVATFLKGLHHVFTDSHLIIELLSVYKMPHYFFPKYGNKRPNNEWIKKHQRENEINYEKWMQNKLCVSLKKNNGKRKAEDMISENNDNEFVPKNKRRKLTTNMNGNIALAENENENENKVDWDIKYDNSPTFEYAVKLYRQSKVFKDWKSVSYEFNVTATHICNTCKDKEWKIKLENILSNEKYRWNGCKYERELNKQLMFDLAHDVGYNYIRYKKARMDDPI